MVDLYIYLKTTYTYYIPHIAHAGNCVAGNIDMKINGKNVKTNIQDNYTTINLMVLSSFFAIDYIMENQIKPNSLPLKIFVMIKAISLIQKATAQDYIIRLFFRQSHLIMT